MVQKSQTTTAEVRKAIKTLANTGISTTNLNWLAGFLNPQQYVIMQVLSMGICYCHLSPAGKPTGKANATPWRLRQVFPEQKKRDIDYGHHPRKMNGWNLRIHLGPPWNIGKSSSKPSGFRYHSNSPTNRFPWNSRGFPFQKATFCGGTTKTPHRGRDLIWPES